MKRYEITIDGRKFDVRLLSDPQQKQVQVEVDGQLLLVEVEAVGADEVQVSSVLAIGSPQQTGVDASPIRQPVPLTSKIVTAPLPGVIKSIAVRLDQRVSVGEELLVIEAMKMDNIIRATRGAKVEAVLVVEGHHVDHGQPLVQYYE
jgi:biotin carboxyl carrier protein